MIRTSKLPQFPTFTDEIAYIRLSSKVVHSTMKQEIFPGLIFMVLKNQQSGKVPLQKSMSALYNQVVIAFSINFVQGLDVVPEFTKYFFGVHRH